MSDVDAPLRVTRRDDGVVLVTLSRPRVLNAISTEMASWIVRLLAELDDTAGSIVLTGDGDRAFGAGLDLRELREADALQRAEQQRTMLAMQRALAECRVLMVAAVNSLAMGASWQTALHCDVVFAAASAQFAMPETTAGQACIVGSWLLGSLVPTGTVADVVLTGRRVPAAEAERLGLVQRVLPDGELLAASIALASELAARRSVAFDATRAWVRRLRYTANGGLENALRHADTVLADINRIPKEAST